MTERQELWARTAAILRKDRCSLRDGVALGELTPKERKERAAQIHFESRILFTPTGNTGSGKRLRCSHK